MKTLFVTKILITGSLVKTNDQKSDISRIHTLKNKYFNDIIEGKNVI